MKLTALRRWIRPGRQWGQFMPDFDFGHVSGMFGIGRGLVRTTALMPSSEVMAETEMIFSIPNRRASRPPEAMEKKAVEGTEN